MQKMLTLFKQTTPKKTSQLITSFPTALKSTSTAQKYPKSLEDLYTISESLPVPLEIVRPDYVGKLNQNHPSLHDKIHILTPEA